MGIVTIKWIYINCMHNKYWPSFPRRVLNYRLCYYSTNFINTCTHTHKQNCKIQPNNILFLFLKSIIFAYFSSTGQLMNSLACTVWVILQSNFLDCSRYCSDNYWTRSVAVSSLKYFQNFTHPPRYNNRNVYLAFSAWSLLSCTEKNPNLKDKLFEEANDT